MSRGTVREREQPLQRSAAPAQSQTAHATSINITYKVYVWLHGASWARSSRCDSRLRGLGTAEVPTVSASSSPLPNCRALTISRYRSYRVEEMGCVVRSAPHVHMEGRSSVLACSRTMPAKRIGGMLDTQEARRLQPPCMLLIGEHATALEHCSSHVLSRCACWHTAATHASTRVQNTPDLQHRQLQQRA